jgi:DNA-binding response OmpR family regulator
LAELDPAFRVPLRVLWIDDEPDLMAVLARDLGDAGSRVDFARDGAGGVQLAARNAYDVILLDWKLPDISGTCVLEQLRLREIRKPVIVLSGYADLDLAVEVVRAGARAVKRKPLSGADLLRAVHAALPRRADVPPGWPWTVRASLALDELSAALTVDVGPLESPRTQFLRCVARLLIESDITIPETVACVAGFNRIASAPLIHPGVVSDVVSALVAATFDRAARHPVVTHAIHVIETWTDGPLPTEAALVQTAPVKVSAAHAGVLIELETRLPWTGWKLGARLRGALRGLADPSRQGKLLALECGWSSPQQFSSQFHEVIGVTPGEFRTLVRR